MRRIRQNLKRTYYLRKHLAMKGSEGNTYHDYAPAVQIEAVIRHASGELAVAEYGERTRYVLHMQYEGTEDIELSDGICVFVGPDERPDYLVTRVRGLTEDAFQAVDLEAVV